MDTSTLPHPPDSTPPRASPGISQPVDTGVPWAASTMAPLDAASATAPPTTACDTAAPEAASPTGAPEAASPTGAPEAASPTAAPEAASPTAAPETASPEPRDWRGRAIRLGRGPAHDPAWARPTLLALLALTGAAYLAGLTANGWANAFYSAAAQAGSESWTALFYGSSDSGNSITVDKPPASLWAMALSVKLLGLSPFSILLPQVLMGVGTVAVVHATVRRRFGHGAAVLAGAALALTPVAVLMFRFNNPDALLTLLMTLAVWATLRAVEAGSVRWIAFAGMLAGLGFLTKSLQVLLVVPAVALVWLGCASTPWRRRLVGGLASSGAFLVAAGWWVAIVELVPASMRPYIGGSQGDSFLELALGYNGLGRLNGTEVGRVGGGGGGGGGRFSEDVGLSRMFDGVVGGQISWLLPAALLLLLTGLWFRGRAPRTDARRASYLIMGTWLVTTALVFSFMQGIFHEYYTVALAPAIAALVGMGSGEAWQRRRTAVGALTLSAATAASAVWAFVLLGRSNAYADWLRPGILVAGLLAAAAMLLTVRMTRRAGVAAAAGAMVATLAGPAAYSASTISSGYSGSIVVAGPADAASAARGPGGTGQGGPGGGAAPGGMRQGRPGGMPDGRPGGMPPGRPVGATAGPGRGGGGLGGLLDATAPDTEVVAALQEGADSSTWAAAAVGSQNAAGLQLAAEEPVMSIGGFNGSDPSPTLVEFQQHVADAEIHWFLAGSGFRNQQGGSSSSTEIAEWVAVTFTEVTMGGQTFYDLTAPVGSGS
ncbi:MAG: glycosyltransferase family 39 protein [Dermatophilaceae bacterium]